MKKTFEKIIRHDYEIDEEKLRKRIEDLIDTEKYEKDTDPIDIYFDVTDSHFDISIDGVSYALYDVETYFLSELYEEIGNTICDMIENIFKEKYGV